MKILVHDHGICLEAAITLARAGHTVLYHVTPVDSHSLHDVAQMGSGFDDEGVIKVNDFYSHLDLVDLICCFDTHCGDEVDWLRKHGYTVFGAGAAAERLELDRWFSKQQTATLPHQRVERCVGVNRLIERLQHTKNVYIKCSGFREIETFKHTDWKTTQEQYIAPLLVAYGTDPDLVFLLEDDVSPAIEVGSDNIYIKGKPLTITPYGYEAKDSAYIGRFNSVLPPALRKVNDVIASDLKDASSFISTEVRVTPSGAGYPVDFTVRAPHPPMAAMLENIPEIVSVITQGTLITSYATIYAAVLCGRSDWSVNHRMEVSFPPNNRRWVKFAKVYKQQGKYYTLPSTSFPVQVVGLGNTINQAINGCRTIVDDVKGRELSFDFSALEKLRDETIPQGRTYGIPF